MKAKPKNQQESWTKDEAQAFQGWDFSYLDGRWHAEPLPWNYTGLVKAYLSPDMKLLDMGTGGGEILLEIGHPYQNTTVTETYPPNIALIEKTLTPLGITVVPTADDDRLPLLDETFDIIINRHESFNAAEVFRVLKPGGVFITQQVGGKNNRALSEMLIEGFNPAFPDWDSAHAAQALADAGFDILKQREFFPTLKFFDTGAVVYFAKVIEWEFPDFSVHSCLSPLKVIEEEIQKNGFFASAEHRFLLIAGRPKQKKDNEKETNNGTG